jgi:glycine cleavage system transcriptional repressor
MREKDYLILTAIGPDRIGLVQTLSDVISRHGCNIEDSKMAAFCGEFAVIILISGDESNLQNIARSHSEIESQTGLTIATKTPSPKKTSEAFIGYKLTATCMDHPGVVHKISRRLSPLHINIESMETKTYSAPMSGTPLFQLEAILAVPVRTNIKELREALLELQRDENIDVAIDVIKL